MAFIVFEGIDGSGKTTLIKFLANKLKSLKIPYIVTREPGGTIISEKLRKILLDKKLKPTPKCELLLYEASRIQHVEEVILPNLRQNKWVLCDRFTPSSVAFQSAGRKICLKQVNWLNNFATNNLKPNLIVLLNISVAKSVKRRIERSKVSKVEIDRLEKEKLSFHLQVQKNYMKQALENPRKWLVLQATNKPEVLFKNLYQHLKEKKWL